MRGLLDENLPHDLINPLVGHSVSTVQGCSLSMQTSEGGLPRVQRAQRMASHPSLGVIESRA